MTNGFIRQSPHHSAKRETSPPSHAARSRPLGPLAPRPLGPFSSAFTLMEILIAIAIFGIGLVAVASIFPAAILLQRETMDQVEAKHFSRSAEAEVAARGFELDGTRRGNLDNDGPSGPNPDVVEPMPSPSTAPSVGLGPWSLFDRSYSALRRGDSQRVFWVPLIYDANSRVDEYDWRVYLFVVRGRQTDAYPADPNQANPSGSNPDPAYVPKVIKDNVGGSPWVPPDVDGDGAPDGVRVGDAVLGSNGVVYPVTDVDKDGEPEVRFPGNPPNAVWYAAPGTENPDNGTFVRLITLIDDEDTNVVREP